jgi:hypothetical protein
MQPGNTVAAAYVTGSTNRRQGKAKTAQASAPTAGRGILTRINPEGLKALRQLAFDRDTTVQALM